MFNELPLSGPERRPTRTRWTFLLSLGGELTVLAVLLLIPLIYVQALPFSWRETSIVPPPPTAPPEVAHVRARNAPPVRNAFTAPNFIPPHAVIISEPRAVPQDSNFATGTGSIPGAIPGNGNGNPWNSIFPQTKPEAPAAPGASGPSRIRVGGTVEAARLLQMVRPVYPPIARDAGIQGTVVLAAVIGTDGTVQELHYISGPPLLVQAAMDAVRQWLYKPTLLDGRPVTVETTIKVIFTLGNSGGGMPPPPARAATGPSRIRVGGNVEAAKLLQMVRPVYPPIARKARIEGTVVLAAVIGTDGTVEELHYISGPPLLVQASMDAVRQWLYKPTLLNGRPVAVETTIKVTLARGDSGAGTVPSPKRGVETAGANGRAANGARAEIRVSPHGTVARDWHPAVQPARVLSIAEHH